MSNHQEMLDVYVELAEIYEEQGQPQMRDRFLLLAADSALSCGQPDEAERLRKRFLAANPHHIVKPYSSFAQALCAPDVQNYVSNLRKNYPEEVAQDLLETLRKDFGPRPAPSTANRPAVEGTANLSGPHQPDFGTLQDEGQEDVAKTAPLPLWIPSVVSNASHEDERTDNVEGTLSPDGIDRTLSPDDRPSASAPSPLEQTMPPQAHRPPARPAPARVPPAETAPPAAPAHRPRGGPHHGRSAPIAPPAPRRQPEEEPESGNSLLAGFLFVLVLLSGMALFGYTVAKPFLP